VYVCLACSSLQTFSAPIASHATLIIMPNTLISQWKAELLKHIAGVTFNNPIAPVGLKVFIYPDGLGSEQGCDYGRADPRHLAQYDIVLMSFRALQKGYHESNVDYASARIQRSSYAVYPPPFLCVRFGLLVVDETQNIETQTTSQILTMACRIPSANRISVSGTPLGSGRLSDLYSLCQFLRVAPLCDRRTWLRLIEKPVVPIPVSERIQLVQEFFADITLRRTKNQIHEQLGLPQHAVLTRPLQFSTFEVQRFHRDFSFSQHCTDVLLCHCLTIESTVRREAGGVL
jgi:SNF2 family DNA or RNA helicase